MHYSDCGVRFVLCPDGSCVAGGYCDGLVDCVDGSDESVQTCRSDSTRNRLIQGMVYNPVTNGCKC